MQIYLLCYIKLFGLILSIDLPKENLDLHTDVGQAVKFLTCIRVVVNLLQSMYPIARDLLNQGSHQDWKTWKMGEHFLVREFSSDWKSWKILPKVLEMI